MRAERWCVLDRFGVWCAVEDGEEPPEGVWNVRTLCEDWITLPFGIDHRYTTCPQCKEREEDGEDETC